MMADSAHQDRDFSSISPSAKALAMLKGVTQIPFAFEAARLMALPEPYTPDYSLRDSTLWGRILHFEERYWSINNLLSGLGAKNILELSSGFSWRGLDAVLEGDVHYIDTDLPELIETKKHFVEQLAEGRGEIKGKLELLPLNALDENAFAAATAHFDAGELVIVNEGLLVYLDTGEKRKLCSIIHQQLKQRGGCWITGDIYVKRPEIERNTPDDELKRFFEQHNIEQNKFENFEQAEAFFKDEGFVVERKAEVNYAQLTALPYFLESVPPELLAKFRDAGKIRESWQLRLAEWNSVKPTNSAES